MSILTPKADISGKHEKGLLLTRSGRSPDYEIRWECTEKKWFPYPTSCARTGEVATVVHGLAHEPSGPLEVFKLTWPFHSRRSEFPLVLFGGAVVAPAIAETIGFVVRLLATAQVKLAGNRRFEPDWLEPRSFMRAITPRLIGAEPATTPYVLPTLLDMDDVRIWLYADRKFGVLLRHRCSRFVKSGVTAEKSVGTLIRFTPGSSVWSEKKIADITTSCYLRLVRVKRFPSECPLMAISGHFEP